MEFAPSFFLDFFWILTNNFKKRKKNYALTQKNNSGQFYLYKMAQNGSRTSKKKIDNHVFMTGECMVCSNGESEWRPVGPTFKKPVSPDGGP